MDAGTRQGASRLRPILWGAAFCLLLVPAIAMRFTAEVRWGPEDFAAAALLLGGAGLGIELAVRRLRPGLQLGAAIAGVVLCFLLVWAQLAVGILA